MGAGRAGSWGSSRALIPQAWLLLPSVASWPRAPPQVRTSSWVWGDRPSSGAENAADSKPVLPAWS